MLVYAGLWICLIAVASEPWQSTEATAGGGPSWNRPGCHKVGHTREISIAGCIKFNLSTNACRGYCMSYSIPATEESIEFNIENLADSEQLIKYNDLNQNNVQLASKKDLTASQQQLQRLLAGTTTSQRRYLDESGMSNSALPGQYPGIGRLRRPMLDYNNTPPPRRLSQSQRMVSVPSGRYSEPGEHIRRDVVSVSQCCNMMETEDIIVNLRCANNETRRLVFKSAKTCECFFCKHV